MQDEVNRHGVFMEIFQQGVLITGPSGVGKSESALHLLDRGHRLIADDAPIFYKNAERIYGRCPPNLTHLLEVRGFGIVNVKDLFGERAVSNEKELDLILELSTSSGENEELDRSLQPELENEIILNIAIPKLKLLISFYKNDAILIECAVRFFKERLCA